ncbi:hypothetical protein ABBQ38_009817 [Trebouxia sp. C0009 RCD-2024]
MHSVHCQGTSLRNSGSLRSVRAPFSKANLRPVKAIGRQGARQVRRMAIVNGDVVADDKLDTKERTAAASSRGFAGLPREPEDMRQSTPAASKFMQEKFDFVKRDFQYCWRSTLNRDNFDSNMYFEDPISKFTNYTGYKANIVFLRNFLAPIYEIHDLKQNPDNEFEILARWSFSMQFWWLRYLPFIKVIWDPRLAFTGITVLGVNPENGKFNKHVDLWDSNEDNSFFSFEGFMFVQSQIWNFSKPANLPTPEFCILKKYKKYEIRRYKPFLVAEVTLNDSAQPKGSNIDPAESDKGTAFKQLAGFLGKKNERGQGLSMTTPVFSKSKQGVMQFYIGEGYKDVSEVPTPKNSSVKIRQEPGGLYGVDLFSGNAKQPRVNEREQQLRSWLQRDGTKPASDEWILAEYNVPWQLPGFKRNEILIPIDESTFELW